VLEGVRSLGAQEHQDESKGGPQLVLVRCPFRSSSKFSNDNLVSMGHRIRLKTKI
jgi:hypothetical protein